MMQVEIHSWSKSDGNGVNVSMQKVRQKLKLYLSGIKYWLIQMCIYWGNFVDLGGLGLLSLSAFAMEQQTTFEVRVNFLFCFHDIQAIVHVVKCHLILNCVQPLWPHGL